MAVWQIPLSAGAQRLSVDLGDGDYSIRLLYRDAPEAGWSMDLDGPGGVKIHGMPLLPGIDLLDQYKYFGIPGRIFVFRAGDGPETFSYADMPDGIQLFYENL